MKLPLAILAFSASALLLSGFPSPAQVAADSRISPAATTYVWDVTGSWAMHSDSNYGSWDFTLVLTQSGTQLTGHIDGYGAGDIVGAITGNTISFERRNLVPYGQTQTYTGSLSQDGTSMSGTFVDPLFTPGGTWSATGVARHIQTDASCRILLLDTGSAWASESLDAIGVAYHVVSPSAFLTTQLASYDLLYIPSTFRDQSVTVPAQDALDALNSRSADIAQYVAAGGGIVALSEPVGNGNYAWTPMAVTASATNHSDNVKLARSHPVNDGLSDALLSNWGVASHHYFIQFDPRFSVLDTNADGQSVSLAANFGLGRIFITGQDPDFHSVEPFGSSPVDPGARMLLANAITWACGANFQQCDSPWGSADYDHLGQDPACNSSLNGNVYGKICDCGCALTAAADVLNFLGVSTNPSDLNTWLTQNGGYDDSGTYRGAIHWYGGRLPNGSWWGGVAAYANSKGVPLVGQKQDGECMARVSQSISEGDPIIVQVWNGSYQHWVLVTGQSGDTWSIHDPLGKQKLSDYGDCFQSVVYKSSNVVPRKLAAILVRAHSPVELVVTDPLGRRVGFDPRSGTSYSEIPDASYGVDTGVVGGEGVKEAIVNTPVDGDYTVDVIGSGTGTYSVEGEAYDQNQVLTPIVGPSGTTSPNQVDTAVIHYSSQPAAVGGIADLPDAPSEPQRLAQSSGGLSTPYAAIVVAAAAGLLAFAAAGWYARRRWLGRR